jgi:hypothetical protein
VNTLHRRSFLRNLGVSAATLPFLGTLRSLTGLHGAEPIAPHKRLVIVFSPNGTLPDDFWPDTHGEDFTLKPILQGLEPFKKQTLLIKGVFNKIRGDGDQHMRGMSCLLTASGLLPGNIMGGGGQPAGWASSISIDQEIKKFLQSRPETRTRFGSLEFGVAVPNRADPWTRMSYLGANQPVAPLDDPYRMFSKLYGTVKDKETLISVLDDVKEDLRKVSSKLSAHDRQLLQQHMELVRGFEKELQAPPDASILHPMPPPDPGVELVNDNTPKISRMQIDLLVNALSNNMARVASLQYMRSVGNAQMRWVGVEEGHHTLSHEPDSNQDAHAKLLKINQWFAGELAYLLQKLRDTPEPSGSGSMLDHTLVVWTNELGKGNSHTLDNVPLVLVGGGAGFRMGRSLQLDKVPHNRLWLSVAHGMGHTSLQTFGQADLCTDGPLDLST